jgi:hypothetical protein
MTLKETRLVNAKFEEYRKGVQTRKRHTKDEEIERGKT